MVIFTDEELNSFTLDQLHRLADYYKQPYTKRTSKKDLIKMLGLIFNPPTEDSENDGIPRMSVRVRRIYELKKKGEL